MNETEEKIRNSAIKFFLRFGFKKSSVDEIAEDAGIAKGTVYNYFKNKQDLFTKTSFWWREQQFKKIEREIAQIEHADEKILTRLILEVMTFRQAYIEYGMTENILRELLSVKQSIKEFREMDVEIFENYLMLGFKQDIFCEQPFRERAELLNTTMFQFAERWIALLDEDDAVNEIRTLIGLILKGMKR